MKVRLVSLFVALIGFVVMTAFAQRRVEVEAPVRVPALLTGSGVQSEKSPLLAAVFSLILPGAGEWYVGDLSGGQYHLMAEGGLWLTYGGMRAYSTWLRNDAQAFAGEYAGANFAGKDADFDVNVGDYISRDAYNQAMLRNRQYDMVYESDEYQWEWQSAEQRSNFRGMRVRSDRYKSDAQFAIAGMVVNRLISAFSANRLARRHNAQLSERSAVDVDLYAVSGAAAGEGIRLHLRATF